MQAKDFAELKAAILEKEVLVHPVTQAFIKATIVVSTIEDVEVAITLGSTAEELRNKVQAVTKTEGIREMVIRLTEVVRPDVWAKK